MTSTRISRHFEAPREAVYRALLDPAWRQSLDRLAAYLCESP